LRERRRRGQASGAVRTIGDGVGAGQPASRAVRKIAAFVSK